MEKFSFADFMLEGGWGMWPILLFGVVALASAAWFGFAPQRVSLRFVAILWLTLLATVAHATITDLAAVFAHFETAPHPDAALVSVLFMGLKESTRPAALGGIFLTLVPLLAAVGVYRDAAR